MRLKPIVILIIIGCIFLAILLWFSHRYSQGKLSVRGPGKMAQESPTDSQSAISNPSDISKSNNALASDTDPSFHSPIPTTTESSQSASGLSGVSSLQELFGKLTLQAGKAIQVNGLTISNGGVTSFQGISGDVTLTAGSGLSIDGVKFENSDRGSTQNIFKNIAVNGQNTIMADSNDDTLTFVAGSGITLLTDKDTGKLTISASGSTYSTSFTRSGTTVYLTNPNDYVGIGTTTPTVPLEVNGIAQARVQDKGGQVYNVKAYGAKGDGVTDDTSAIQSAINAASNDSGGIIYFPHGTYIIANQLTFPNNGGTPYPTQKSMRLTGEGPGKYATQLGPKGGSILDLKYDDPVAKIDTRGRGFLEIDHLTLKDSVSDSSPFIQSTNTTLHIHDVEFYGNQSAPNVDQDAIILGGTSTIGSGASDSPFSGYGTVIENNFFLNIRRGAYLRKYANGIIIRDNTWMNGSSNLADGAAIEIDGGSGYLDNGNYISGNLIQMQTYKYAIKVQNATMNTFVANNFFDAVVGTTIGFIRFESTASNNFVMEGTYNNSASFIAFDDANGTNSRITAHINSSSFLPQLSTTGNMGVGTLSPSARLHISRTGGSPLLRIENVTQSKSGFLGISNSASQLLNGDAAGNFDIYANSNINFSTDNTNVQMTLTTTGRLGIGTTSPSSLFSVGSSSQFQVNSSGAIATTTGITSTGNLSFTGAGLYSLAGLSTNGLVKTTGGTGTLAVATAGTDYQLPLTFTNGLTNSSNTVSLGGTLTGATTLANGGFNLSITGTGNVGIGTAPSYKLDLADSGTTAGIRGLNVSQTGVVSGTGYAGYFSKTGGSTTNIGLYTEASGATNNYGLVVGAGNVGIGTTAPGAMLHIARAGSPILRLDNTSATKTGSLGISNSTNQLLNGDVQGDFDMFASNGKINFSTDATNTQMTLASGGKVGIGITSPSGYLDIGPSITALASATNYGLRIDPTLSGAINTAQTALYQNYNVPTINLTGGTSNTLTTLYGNYIGLTNTAGTVSTWYGDYIAAPTGAGTITNKYALVTEATAGNIGIGTTAPTTFKLEVGGAIGPTTDNTFDFGSSGKRWVNLYASNGTVQTSDARLKDNIQNIDYGLTTLMKLRPVSFNWKNNHDSGRKLGLIAQEVQPIVGELVNVGSDSDNTLGIYYDELIPVIIKGIQEQQYKIDVLDAKVQDKDQADSATIASKIDALTIQTGQMKNDLIQVHTALDSQKEEIASLSARLEQGLAEIKTLKGSEFTASNSAILNSSLSTTTISSLATSSALFDDLIVTGKTNVNSLGVTGTISAGLITITGLDTSNATPSASIETLAGPLHLQKNGFGPLELMADKIVIDDKGNLGLNEGNIDLKKGKFIGNDTIRGVVTLPAGQHKVTVKQVWDTAPISISVITTYDAHLWIEDLTKDGFTANVNPVATSDAKIYWSAIW